MHKKGATVRLAGLMIVAILSSRSTKVRLTELRKHQGRFAGRKPMSSAMLCVLQREWGSASDLDCYLRLLASKTPEEPRREAFSNLATESENGSRPTVIALPLPLVS